MIKKLRNIFLLLLCLLNLLNITACSKSSEDEIRSRMETHLQEKYGEPFVVENIGMRDTNGQKFYTAKIYPKAIMGTDKEDDSHYYATVNIDILAFGRLAKIGDTYGEVKTKEEAENYLLPKVKELFGDRVRLTANPELEVKTVVNKKETYWLQYITPHFKIALDKSRNDSSNYRLKMGLAIYVFDRIDDEKEKEERQKEIFNFIQYLKKEGLFKYLDLDVIFLDDYVITDEFQSEGIHVNNSTDYIYNGESLSLPSRDEINSIYEKCKSEFEKMSEIEVQKRINLTLKDNLSYEYYAKYGAQMSCEIYSPILAKAEYKVAVEIGEIKISDYNNVNDISIIKEKKYLFNNDLKEKETK